MIREYRRWSVAIGIGFLSVTTMAAPVAARTDYVAVSGSTARVAAAQPKMLEARSRSWLVSNAIKLYTTIAKGHAIIFR